MYRIAKNIVKNLVVSKEVAILAMPNVHSYSDQVHISDFRDKAGLFCGTTSFVSSGRLATITGEARPFHITFRPCQTSLKADQAHDVCHLHPTSKVPICTAATYVRRYLFSALTRLTIRMSTARRTHGTPSDISSPTSETLTPIIPCL